MYIFIILVTSFTSFGKTGEEAQNPSSVASNYKMPLQVSVNERTGKANMSFKLNTIPGIVSENSINLSLTFNGLLNNGKKSFLGLPSGWTYQMDYLSKQGRLVFLHLANGSSYAINTDGVNDLPSHLRYYKLHGLVMTRNGEISKRNEIHQKLVLSDKKLLITKTNNNKKIKLNTPPGWTLVNKLNNTKEHFSFDGLLLSSEDSYGNKIVYHYVSTTDGTERTDGTVFDDDLLLSKITTIPSGGQIGDPFYQSMNITKTKDASEENLIRISYPDGEQTEIRRNIDNQLDNIKSTNGSLSQSIQFNYDEGDKKITITWPNGLKEDLYIKDKVLHYSPTSASTMLLPVIKQLTLTDESGINTPIVTQYNYEPMGNQVKNYTGYSLNLPAQDQDQVDRLMEFGTSDYQYQTHVTLPNGLFKETTFNKFHLPIQVSIFNNDNEEYLLSKTNNVYGCNMNDGPNDDSCLKSKISDRSYKSLPANYQTPSVVDKLVCNNNWSEEYCNTYGRTHRIETRYNENGLPVVVYELEKKPESELLNQNIKNPLSSMAMNTFQISKITQMNYDSKFQNKVTRKLEIDCKQYNNNVKQMSHQSPSIALKLTTNEINPNIETNDVYDEYDHISNVQGLYNTSTNTVNITWDWDKNDADSCKVDIQNYQGDKIGEIIKSETPQDPIFSDKIKDTQESHYDYLIGTTCSEEDPVSYKPLKVYKNDFINSIKSISAQKTVFPTDQITDQIEASDICNLNTVSLEMLQKVTVSDTNPKKQFTKKYDKYGRLSSLSLEWEPNYLYNHTELSDLGPSKIIKKIKYKFPYSDNKDELIRTCFVQDYNEVNCSGKTINTLNGQEISENFSDTSGQINNNLSTQNIYDGLGRLVFQRDATGQTLSYVYKDYATTQSKNEVIKIGPYYTEGYTNLPTENLCLNNLCSFQDVDGFGNILAEGNNLTYDQNGKEITSGLNPIWTKKNDYYDGTQNLNSIGKLKQENFYNPSKQDAPYAYIKYTYDLRGQVINKLTTEINSDDTSTTNNQSISYDLVHQSVQNKLNDKDISKSFFDEQNNEISKFIYRYNNDLTQMSEGTIIDQVFNSDNQVILKKVGTSEISSN